MKFLITLFGFLLGLQAQAVTIQAVAGQVYLGQEYVNDKATGKVCAVMIDEVTKLTTKGLHCTSMNARLLFTGLNKYVGANTAKMYARITNYDTPEFNRGLKTCAEKVSGAPAFVTKLTQDDTYLYNELFSTMTKVNGIEFHQFITTSSVTKKPMHAKVHFLSWNAEGDYDCANLVQH